LLCLFAVIGFVERQSRIAGALGLFAVGLLGLFLTKSAIAAVAVCTTISLYVVWHGRERDQLTPVLLCVAATLALLGGILTTGFLRPSDFRGVFDLTGGSFMHRLMVASSGLLLFLRGPLLGLGWQMSAAPEVLSDPYLNATLQQWFPNAPQHYFPATTPTSLHNMYLHLLVELGSVGMLILFLFFVSVAHMAKEAVRTFPDIWSVYFSYTLILLLVWWNASALWGGQIETFMAFTAIGLLAASVRCRDKFDQ
jgi:hypothetical protein